MALNIENPAIEQTTTKEFALQVFDLPFDMDQPTGLGDRISALQPQPQFLMNFEYPERLNRTPTATGIIQPSTPAFSTLYSKTYDLPDIIALLKQSTQLITNYTLFNARLMLRLEIIGAANYQGAVAYTVTDGYLNNNFVPTMLWNQNALMYDSSQTRRLFYQNPKMIPLDRATYIDIEVPLTFPLPQMPTEYTALEQSALGNYPMATFNLVNLVPMATTSEKDMIMWSLYPYLTDVSYSAVRIPTTT